MTYNFGVIKFSFIPKEVKLLSLSFLFIFFGYNSVQNFITPFFSESGITNVGFQILILIFLFFLLGGPLSAIFVSKFGAKQSMITASMLYSIFIASLLSQNLPFVYLTSALVGIAAAFLWTGQNSYLIMASSEKSFGANSGYFNTYLSFGSAIGVLILGFLASRFSFSLPYALYSFFPIIGTLLLLKLPNLGTIQRSSQLKLIAKSVMSISALRVSAFYFSFSFIFGLIISIIPIDIKNTLSIAYAGGLLFIFWIMPILLSYFFGKVSDIKGRKFMIIASYIIGVLGLTSLLISLNALFLILGVVLLAIGYAIFRPISFALVGDVSTNKTLVSLTALFWMAQNIGILSALLISSQIQTQTIYLLSILVVVICFVILLPLLSIPFKEIKLKLAEEIR